MDHGYFNYIYEIETRKSELFMTNELYNMYKHQYEDETLWSKNY